MTSEIIGELSFNAQRRQSETPPQAIHHDENKGRRRPVPSRPTEFVLHRELGATDPLRMGVAVSADYAHYGR